MHGHLPLLMALLQVGPTASGTGPGWTIVVIVASPFDMMVSLQVAYIYVRQHSVCWLICIPLCSIVIWRFGYVNIQYVSICTISYTMFVFSMLSLSLLPCLTIHNVLLFVVRPGIRQMLIHQTRMVSPSDNWWNQQHNRPMLNRITSSWRVAATHLLKQQTMPWQPMSSMMMSAAGLLGCERR